MAEFPKQIMILVSNDHSSDLVTSHFFCRKCFYTCLENGAWSYKNFKDLLSQSQFSKRWPQKEKLKTCKKKKEKEKDM